MKILLVYPPKWKSATWVWVPLGLSYIGSVLKKEGHEVRGIDLRCQPYDFYIDTLKAWKPDWVGFTLETVTYEDAKPAIKDAKLNGSNVMVGGPHASVNPTEVIALPYVDIVVVGEGEETVKELVCGKPLEDVRGIYYKDAGNIKQTLPRPYIKDLDTIPFPDRDLFPIKTYLDTSYLLFPVPSPNLHLVASRGCPNKCTFCQPTVKNMFGAGIRYRSVDNVIEELKFLKMKYKLKAFHFQDDLPVANKKWIIKFCEELIRNKLELKWTCQSRANTMDSDRAVMLKKAGCIAVAFGFESGSQRILDWYHKGITVEDSLRAAKICKENGIMVLSNLMIGAPHEDIEDLDMTYQLFKNINPELAWISIVSPYPGTYLYDECNRDGLITVKTYHDYDRVLNTPKLKTAVSIEILNRYAKLMERRLPQFKFFVSEPYYRKAVIQWLMSAIHMRKFGSILIESTQILGSYYYERRKTENKIDKN